MKIWKPLVFGLLFVGGITLSGCHLQEGGTKLSQEESTQQEAGMKQKEISKGVLESFEKTLSYYPTSNIDDLLNEDGKKQAILDMRINDESSGKDSFLYSKGMTLYIDTKTKKGHGFYFEDTYYNDSTEDSREKKYPVVYDRGIHLKESTGNSELDRKIENFEFLFQYANFGSVSSKKLIKADYNPKVPLFSAEYQLSNNDSLVKKLRKDYGFDQKGAPILVLDGRGNYRGPSINDFDYRSVDIYFSRNPQHSVSSSVDYTDDVVEEGNY